MRLKRLHEDAKLPEYKTEGSAGFDLSVIEGTLIAPGEIVTLSTGWACELPQGTELQIRPRSGLACKRGITVVNSPGTIDSDYRGEIKIALVNLSNNAYCIKSGERVAQGILAEYRRTPIILTDKLSTTGRGEGGFGSTGRD